eukprot:1519517-Rhodomonas_salina.1
MHAHRARPARCSSSPTRNPPTQPRSHHTAAREHGHEHGQRGVWGGGETEQCACVGCGERRRSHVTPHSPPPAPSSQLPASCQ